MILFIYNHFRYYLQFQTIAIITNTSLQLLRLHAINTDVIEMIKNAFYYNKKLIVLSANFSTLLFYDLKSLDSETLRHESF